MNYLRKKRKTTGISMSELSMKAKVSYSLLCRWERGWALPSVQSAGKLAIVLDLSIDDLFPNEKLSSIGGE